MALLNSHADWIQATSNEGRPLVFVAYSLERESMLFVRAFRAIARENQAKATFGEMCLDNAEEAREAAIVVGMPKRIVLPSVFYYSYHKGRVKPLFMGQRSYTEMKSIFENVFQSGFLKR